MVDLEKFPLGKLVSDYNHKHKTCLGSRGKSTLVLPATMMQSFFDPIISSIIDLVRALLRVLFPLIYCKS